MMIFPMALPSSPLAAALTMSSVTPLADENVSWSLMAAETSS